MCPGKLTAVERSVFMAHLLEGVSRSNTKQCLSKAQSKGLVLLINNADDWSCHSLIHSISLFVTDSLTHPLIQQTLCSRQSTKDSMSFWPPALGWLSWTPTPPLNIHRYTRKHARTLTRLCTFAMLNPGQED